MIKKIAAGVALGLINKDAAELAGITERAFYKWRARGRAELQRLEGTPRAKVRKSELPFVQFVQALKKAEPQKKRALIGAVRKAAVGGDRFTETKRVYKRVPIGEVKGGEADGATQYENVLVEETVTEKSLAPQWQAAAWMLERQYPNEFGRRVRADIYDWRQEILQMLQSGAITPEDVHEELGDELAASFFEQAGIPFAGVRAAEAEVEAEAD